MKPNPLLKKLGYAEDDRLVILHTDDIGMCQASVQAFAELDAVGIITSGAVMVPCPWFPKAAEYARAHPSTDLGVHLTLTSEWPTYRWGPVSSREKATGMLDEEGFFPHRSETFQQHADPAAARIEMAAQLARARQFGMQPTHIDTHMGTVAHPKFLKDYVELALTGGVPAMMFRTDESGWMQMGLDAETAASAARMMEQLEERGFTLLDDMVGLDLGKPANRLEQARAALAELKPGITHFIIHPSVDTPELRAITPDWQARVADYETFRREDLRTYLQSIGVHAIGYRTLQQQMLGLS